MKLTLRARLFVIRRPWLYWIVVATAATAIGLMVRTRVESIDDARDAWGETRLVWVADRDLYVGETAAATLREQPSAMVPPAAVSAETDIGILRQAVRHGEVIVDADLADDRGPAALADPGEAVVAINDPLAVTIMAGSSSTAGYTATSSTNADSIAGAAGVAVAVYADGVVLADDAQVVMFTDDVAFVAVDADEAPIVAAAALLGTASLGFTR